MIPQVGSGEAEVYIDLTPTFVGAARLFLVDPLVKSVFQNNFMLDASYDVNK